MHERRRVGWWDTKERLGTKKRIQAPDGQFPLHAQATTPGPMVSFRKGAG